MTTKNVFAHCFFDVENPKGVAQSPMSALNLAVAGAPHGLAVTHASGTLVSHLFGDSETTQYSLVINEPQQGLSLRIDLQVDPKSVRGKYTTEADIERAFAAGTVLWRGDAVITVERQAFVRPLAIWHNVLVAHVCALEALQDNEHRAGVFARRVMLGLTQ